LYGYGRGESPVPEKMFVYPRSCRAADKDNDMTKTLEVKSRGKDAREEKIKKAELLRFIKVLAVSARNRRVLKGAGKAVPRKSACGTRLSQANLGLLREYFAMCLALRREYNGVEGV